eukprot:TRINITY_DN40968_c0_g1_i1.p2 TRINITY_DN40968_c0_g1~~TRINITY_DN40968_c0_g1_i1.p2  ORF type:complete len:106 (-),score=9.65 TRINITY_DN40968_c0_g1_i1:77-355(-)
MPSRTLRHGWLRMRDTPSAVTDSRLVPHEVQAVGCLSTAVSSDLRRILLRHGRAEVACGVRLRQRICCLRSGLDISQNSLYFGIVVSQLFAR